MMKVLGLLVALAVGLAGVAGYLVTGQTLLLALGGVGVALATGGYVLVRGSTRRW